MIFVRKPQIQEVDPDSRIKTIDAKVGGCCGCFTTNSKSVVTFERNQYFMGETAKVSIKCDNSACNKDIKAF